MTYERNKSATGPGPDGQSTSQLPMRWPGPVWAGLIALVVGLAVVAACAPNARPPAPAPSSTATSAPTATAAPVASAQPVAMTTRASTPTQAAAIGTQKSWILLPPMPATATQADVGAEIYRLVCGTCHGFAGEGLSYGPWVKTDPENCWQANCHGGGHPPGGFKLPHTLPAVIGPGTLTHFQNALALYQYVHATMPMYAPGTMLDEEYWEVTAFLVRANGDDPIKTPLDAQRAAAVTLH